MNDEGIYLYEYPKRERIFKKSYARELVGIAKGDLDAAIKITEDVLTCAKSHIR